MEKFSNDRPDLEEKLSELEILRQSVEQAKAKEKETYDQLLRLSAEFQNFRKRSEARVVDARNAGREDVLLEVITLSDALQQAETSSKNATDVESLKKGLSLVREQFEKFLRSQGLSTIPALGEKLDPHRHEAIAQIENPDVEEGVIIDEIQRGYILGTQVVRPAKVRVAKKPAATAEVSSNQEEQNHG